MSIDTAPLMSDPDLPAIYYDLPRFAFDMPDNNDF